MQSRIALVNRSATLVLLAAGLAACSLESQQAPALTGPSGFAQAVSLTATPDELPRDGGSQAAVTAFVHNEDGRPVSGQRLALTLLAPTPTGTRLSVSEVTTGSDGRASFNVLAPPRTVTGDAIVVGVQPITSDSAEVPLRRTIEIRLTPSNPNAPAASFDFTPTTPTATEPITFDASATRDEGLPCPTTCTFTWDFGDGTTATGRIVQKTFATAGSKTVMLTVADTNGAEATTTRTVDVLPLVPPSSVTITVAPNPPVVNQPANFTASATPGTNRTIVQFEWNFGDGTTVTTSSGSATHTYSAIQTYAVSVTAVDDKGLRGSATTSFTVAGPAAPVANISVSPTGTRPPGSTIHFDAAGSSVGAGASIESYTWIWGDGSANTETSSAQTTHSYSAPGTYTVRLIVEDNFGRTATTTATVTVGP